METSGAAAAAEASRGEAQRTYGEAAADINKEQLKKDIANYVLGAFGLRPFHVFDGEKYHVCFAAVKELVDDVDCDVELWEDFFSNCRQSPTVSHAHEDPLPLLEEASPAAPVPAPDAEKRRPQVRENDCIAASPPSPKEVYYIMEEHYLSASPTPREIDHGVENQTPVENQPVVVGKNHHVPLINPRTLKEIHFVMEDNYLSPEELRLSIYFPLLVSPPPQAGDVLPGEPNDAPMDEPPPSEARPSNDRVNGGNVLEVSTRSNAGKVKVGKGSRPKKNKAKVIEECDASQSVRPDKPWTVKASSRKRKTTTLKTATKEPPEEWVEPPWNGLNAGDLEEQTGDSWVEDEKLRGLLEENPGDVVNPGQTKKSFWPTPLYGSPGRQVKVPPPSIEKGIQSPSFAGSEEESSEVEDFEESVEQSRKREEVALVKYALLFKDDQSWRKKFLDGFKLTCDICYSKRLLGPNTYKTKRFRTISGNLKQRDVWKRFEDRDQKRIVDTDLKRSVFSPIRF